MAQTDRNRRRVRVAMLQADPGPWSGLLIAWVATLLVILIFGLVMLFSASYTTGYLRFNDSYHFIRTQVLCAGLGLLTMVVFSHINYRWLRQLCWLGYAATLIALVAVFAFDPINGCRRWITLPGGLTVQVSEIAKFEMILLTAHLACRAGRPQPAARGLGAWFGQRVVRELAVPLAFLVPVVVLLFFEPHMSGIVLMCAIVGTILLLGNCGGRFTKVCAVLAIAGLRTLLEQIDHIPYLQDRLDGWTTDLAGMTDQTRQSLYAIGSGGLTGLGLGNSVEKQLWLPECTNDFIFSVVCEELGFVGALAVIVLFVLFIVLGLVIAFEARDRYATLVGVGIMAQVAWQVFCNIAVVTNTLPNTGISLPFFSSGGTSLILLLAEMGTMLNIGRNGERRRTEAARRRAVAAQPGQAAPKPPIVFTPAGSRQP